MLRCASEAVFGMGMRGVGSEVFYTERDDSNNPMLLVHWWRASNFVKAFQQKYSETFDSGATMSTPKSEAFL